jgi:hypothetical protein
LADCQDLTFPIPIGTADGDAPGVRLLANSCGEQASESPAKEVSAGERPQNMSEQRQGFMQQLDGWTEAQVIKPAIAAWREYQDLLDQLPEEDAKDAFRTAMDEVKKAVREKVLESYRNGQQAGPRRQSTKQK